MGVALLGGASGCGSIMSFNCKLAQESQQLN